MYIPNKDHSACKRLSKTETELYGYAINLMLYVKYNFT